MRWHPRRLILSIVIGCIASIIVVGLFRTGKWGWNWRHPRQRKLIAHKFDVGDERSQFFLTDASEFTGLEEINRLKDDKMNDALNNNNMILGFGQLLNMKKYSENNAESKIKFNMNTVLSDNLPLNRRVPDSRPDGCESLTYPQNLPTVSIVIPFHNEWPSVLLRTIYSLINRTSHAILKQIILVDDASSLGYLKSNLEKYINSTFTVGPVVKIVRLKERQGLIRARLEGFRHVTSEVVSFFDSHMEVNKDWVEPLLNEIIKNPNTVAMAQLDYIDKETFEYKFYENYRTRYGFKWDMEFFETFFRPDQLDGKLDTDPLPGVLMVGPGFAVRSEYFRDLGQYDSGMKIWGGENIEFAWRTWMCGGQLLHVPCSRVGHIERSQPYSFPQGRKHTELHNYKRAAEVFMGPYKKYVFDSLPGIKDVDIGSLEDRKKIKDRLTCKDFSWFLKTIWPELLPYDEVGTLWGRVKMLNDDVCLDNDKYLFMAPNPLKMLPCEQSMIQQGFALTYDGHLRTTLHCVVAIKEGIDLIPFIQNCMLDLTHKWKYDEQQRLVHLETNTCLQVMSGGKLTLQPCRYKARQKWLFIKNKEIE